MNNSNTHIVILGDNTTFRTLKLQHMKLSLLKQKGINLFSLAQAKSFGISASLLGHYLKKGLVSRVSHGIYRLADSDTVDFESLVQEKLKATPYGIIGFHTAIRLFGLTEELPGEIDIIVPSSNIPKRRIEDVVFHATRTDFRKLDTKTIRGIPVTSIEQTIVDLLRTGGSTSQVIAIYKEAKAKRLDFSLTKLKKLAGIFRAKRKVEAFLGAVL
jgi:predicted transcriptional regulator of viral defense system